MEAYHDGSTHPRRRCFYWLVRVHFVLMLQKYLYPKLNDTAFENRTISE